MDDIVLLLVGAVFGNDFALRAYRARRPLAPEGAASSLVAALTGVVAVGSTALAWGLERIALAPLGLPELRVFAGLGAVAAVALAAGALLARWRPDLRPARALLDPLVAANGVVAGVIVARIAPPTAAAALVVATAFATAFAVALPLFRALHERLEIADVPAPWRGTPIALVTAGLMSLALAGVAGLVSLP